MSKYHAKKTTRMMPNGKLRTFDSQKEAARYDELAALLRAGKISDLRLQPEYTLQEAFVDSTGEPFRAVKYKADFTYVLDGVRVVEDVKGVKTKDYELKRKLVRDRFCVRIQEV